MTNYQELNAKFMDDVYKLAKTEGATEERERIKAAVEKELAETEKAIAHYMLMHRHSNMILDGELLVYKKVLTLLEQKEGDTP